MQGGREPTRLIQIVIVGYIHFIVSVSHVIIDKIL